MTSCAVCKTSLNDGAKFCHECGAAAPDASVIDTTFNAAVDFVGGVAEETGKTVSGVLRDETAQKVVGGAAVGAIAAIFLPVTLATGALVGAGVMAAKQLTKK